jgi:hypothetical protein
MRRRYYLAAWVLSVAVFAVAGLALWHYHFGRAAPTPKAAFLKTPAQPAVTSPKKLETSYLMSGDVFWGRGIDYFAQRSPLKYDWPFSRLNEFHPENYNGWISDMECPVTDINVPYQTQVDSLIFSCSPKYLSAASKFFSAFTIANNHTGNTGAQGFADTQTNLTKAGIQVFGHYDLSQINDLCEVVSMSVVVDGRNDKLPIAMCGYHWLARMPTDEELAQITNYSKYFPVWVFTHGGTEYATRSNPQQRALYRKMIDLGADAVFGDHPHVVQETEAYKGHLIVYDFGNLIFDQWFDKEVTKSLIVNTKITATVDANLQKYLDMGQTCMAFKDTCLQTAQSQDLKAYKLNYTYDIIAGERSSDSLADRLTHPAGPATQAWLEQRTDWVNTLAGLAIKS